ncbi:hypothetical protein THSYN_10480 [Candidatus Thiodictyon syntrophicum]|uniref:PEP-CTERM protein-sorting domain-containing protein n=1 Tax=Candidatus Thiodictyon syntrophicum TaxID=1166950 RepID=A0A2K8UGL8_9GAMM|nr:hypothetical protein THSYN_10480 [Candidatus Thiodictyon syntrophicum]
MDQYQRIPVDDQVAVETTDATGLFLDFRPAAAPAPAPLALLALGAGLLAARRRRVGALSETVIPATR